MYPGKIYDLVERLTKIAENTKSLDIGCGPRGLGSLSNIDVGIYHKSKSQRNFVLGDAHTLPYKDNTFESVFLVEVIEHVDNPTKVLREIRRVLKKNGKLYLTTPNMIHLAVFIRYLLQKRIAIHADHINAWCWESLVWLLHNCGFKDMEVRMWGHVDEMQKSGKPFKLYRSYRLCNLLDKLGFRWSFLYLNIFVTAAANK